MITRPETIREVFAADRDVFRAGEANAVMSPVLGRHSLLVIDGERHLRHRRMLTGPFHGEAVRVYRERVAQLAAAEVERWPVGEELGGPRRCIGASFAMMEMRAILRTVLERAELRAPTRRAERARVHHITLVPARGARAIVTRRRARSAAAPAASGSQLAAR